LLREQRTGSAPKLATFSAAAGERAIAFTE
jgi:hypothetical protein